MYTISPWMKLNGKNYVSPGSAVMHEWPQPLLAALPWQIARGRVCQPNLGYAAAPAML